MVAEGFFKRMSRRLRVIFFKGLAALLPTALTIYIIVFLFGFVKNNISRPINTFIGYNLARWSEDVRGYMVRHYNVDETVFAVDENGNFVDPEAVEEELAAKLPWWPAFVLVVFVIFVVGALLASFMGRRIWRAGERLLSRTPVINLIYPHVKQVTSFLFGEDKPQKKYSRVVAVQFPFPGSWSVGLVTGEGLQPVKVKEGSRLVTVFVPCSPAPMSGFTVIVREDETIPLNMSVDEAMRFIISCGVITPEALLTDEGRASLNAQDTRALGGGKDGLSPE